MAKKKKKPLVKKAVKPKEKTTLKKGGTKTTRKKAATIPRVVRPQSLGLSVSNPVQHCIYDIRVEQPLGTVVTSAVDTTQPFFIVGKVLPDDFETDDGECQIKFGANQSWTFSMTQNGSGADWLVEIGTDLDPPLPTGAALKVLVHRFDEIETSGGLEVDTQ